MDALTEKPETAENERLVLDMVDKFLETEVRPHVRAQEHDDVYPTDIVEKMKAMGLFGCIIAPQYGGLGLSTSTYAKIIERISSVWMSISGIINSHLIMSMVVQRNGTEEQKTAFLPNCNRRIARRCGAYGTGLWHRSAERPHRGQARGRRVCGQRPQDLDHQ